MWLFRSRDLAKVQLSSKSRPTHQLLPSPPKDPTTPQRTMMSSFVASGAGFSVPFSACSCLLSLFSTDLELLEDQLGQEPMQTHQLQVQDQEKLEQVLSMSMDLTSALLISTSMDPVLVLPTSILMALQWTPMDHLCLELPQFLLFLPLELPPSLQSPHPPTLSLQSTTNSQLSGLPQLLQSLSMLLQLPTILMSGPQLSITALLLSLLPSTQSLSSTILPILSPSLLNLHLFLTNLPIPVLHQFLSSLFQLSPQLFTLVPLFTMALSDPLVPIPSQPKCTTLLTTTNSCLQSPSNDDFYSDKK